MVIVRYLLILLFVMLSACQATTAVTSEIDDSIACDSIEKGQNFPSEGARKIIGLSFRIKDGGELVSFTGEAVCEYQGNICGGGIWFQVWYGDQSVSQTVPISNGDEIVFWPHSFCTLIDGYEKKCLVEDCDPTNFFKLRLELSDSHAQSQEIDDLDWTKGKTKGSVLLTEREFLEYGYEFEYFEIKVADEGL